MLKRFVQRIVIFSLKILFLLWLAFTLWNVAIDHRGYDSLLLARFATGAWDALIDLPGAVLYGLAVFMDVLTEARFELADQLGHDPFDVAPRTDPWAGERLAIPSLGLSALISSLVGVAIIMAMTQFGALLLAFARDDEEAPMVTWRYPGVVHFSDGRLRIRHMAITGGVAILISLQALTVGVLTGVLCVVAVVAMLRYPLGGYPVWLMTIYGVRLRLDDATVESFRVYWSDGLQSVSESDQHTERAQRPKTDHHGTRHNKTHFKSSRSYRTQHLPEGMDQESRYRQHCEIMQLEPHSFTRVQLNAQRRHMILHSHPDAGGTHDAARAINGAFEFILIYHGWGR